MKYYISFDGVYGRTKDHFKRADIVNTYIAWLNENVGVEETDWYWRRGDLLAEGVYIKGKACAVAFKLRFEI